MHILISLKLMFYGQWNLRFDEIRKWKLQILKGLSVEEWLNELNTFNLWNTEQPLKRRKENYRGKNNKCLWHSKSPNKGRTIEVKSMSSEVSLRGFKFWLYHLVLVCFGFLFCEMRSANKTYLIGSFCKLIENMRKKCLA